MTHTDAYLFVSFTGTEKTETDEQIYFALSRNALTWQDLSPAGQPVLRSTQGDRGVRDPWIVCSPQRDRFFLLATDLSIYHRGGWGNSNWQHSSTKLAVWESPDLVNWSDMRLVDVAGDIPGAGMAWAPEAVWDPDDESYFVFWSTLTHEPEALGQSHSGPYVFYSRTRDFHTFTLPELWMTSEQGVIDATVMQANDGTWWRAARDDKQPGRGDRNILECCATLTGDWQRVSVTQDIFGDAWSDGPVEGPILFRFNESPPAYGLALDRFSHGKGYQLLRTTNLNSTSLEDWQVLDVDLGKVMKRHGGILPITQAEYERILAAHSGKNPIIPGLFADPSTIVPHEGRYYMICTTDGYPGWSASVLHMFSSADLRSWHNHGVVIDAANITWASHSLWAPALTQKNGMFYAYFSAHCPQSNAKEITVAWAQHPLGPWHTRETPMLTLVQALEVIPAMGQTIDPDIFTCAQTGKSYMLFGNCQPAIVELTPCMTDWVRGTLRHLDGAVNFREAVCVQHIDGRYHFSWSCDDTRSPDYHVRYGISQNLFGPIEDRGVLLARDDTRGIVGTGHHNIYHDESYDAWYILYHRHSDPGGQSPGTKREICMERLDYRDGRFLSVCPSHEGVNK